MRPRFSLHELFLTITLMAVGIFGITVLTRATPESGFIRDAAPFVYFGSAILIGIGLGVPFQQRTTGGVLGFGLSIVVLVLLAIFSTTSPGGGPF